MPVSVSLWLVLTLLLPTLAAAQGGAPLPRIGYLGNTAPNPAPKSSPVYWGFQDGLKDFGYRDGQTIVIDYRFASGRIETLPVLARELVEAKDAVLFVGGDQGLSAGKEATKASPDTAVVAVTCDLLGLYVASLRQHNPNATGTTCMSGDLAAKRLELLTELMPGLKRLAVLYNPGDPNKEAEFDSLAAPAARLGLDLSRFKAGTAAELTLALGAIAAARVDALLMLDDTFLNLSEPITARFSLEHRLPSMYGFREFADAGGLLTYGANLRERSRRAVALVDKILKGTKPGDIPVEQPTKFELVINAKTAKALGLAVPSALLVRADEIIE